MPDILDETGLQVKSYTEISDELKLEFTRIFGDELNFESNTQDGQMIGLFAQSGVDIREMILSIWNDLFADTAQGKALDRLYSILGVTRNAGNKARVSIQITTDRENITLQGLDGKDNPNAFTVSDGNSNNFQLESTLYPSDFTENKANAVFVAVNDGYLQIERGTITNIVTTKAGVLEVTNLEAPFETGSDFETDSQFRYKAKLGNSANKNRGSKELIESALLEKSTGVKEVLIVEDRGSIHIICNGGNAEKIAEAIYKTKAAGIQTIGNEKNEVTIKGTKIRFDYAQEQILHYKLTVSDRDRQINRIDKDKIAEIAISNNFSINQKVSQLEIAEKIFENFRNLIITKSLVSINGTDWVEFAEPNANSYFKIKLDNKNITVDG